MKRRVGGGAVMLVLSLELSGHVSAQAASTAPQRDSTELAVLVVGGAIRIHNNQLLDRGDWEAKGQAASRALASDDERIRRAGGLLRLVYALGLANADGAATARKHLRSLSGVAGLVAADGACRAFLGEEAGTFNEFRNGPGRIVEDWLFEGRRQEIARMLSAADSFHASSQLAGAVEELGVVRAATPRVELEKWASFKAFGSLRRDGIRHKGKPWGKGLIGTWGAECTYTGATPLTNVILVACVQTKGASIELDAGQKRVLGFNAGTGMGNHNADIVRLMQAQNLVGTMPIAGFAYVASLKKGDNLKVALPESVDREAYQGITVRLCADQGLTPAIRIDKAGKPAPVTGGSPGELVTRAALAPGVLADLEDR